MFKRCYLASVAFFLSLLVILAINSEPPVGPRYVTTQTSHYDLLCEPGHTREYGELLEQAYSQFHEFFGVAPAWRGRLEVFADTADYTAALEASGTFEAAMQAERTGGMYHFGRDVAHVKRNPSEWFTHGAVVHEAAHQFHFQARTKGQSGPSSSYYTEGLAKYFEHRHWDGTTLHKDVIREPLNVDIYRATLERFRTHRNGQMRNIATDPGNHGSTGRVNYDEAYLFVRYLIECYPGVFRKLSEGLDQVIDPGAAWDGVFGTTSDEVDAGFETWLQERVRHSPYVIWSGLWQQAGQWIEGSVQDRPEEKSKQYVGQMELKTRTDSISLEIGELRGSAKAGVFLYDADKTTHFIMVAADGTIKAQRLSSNAEWTTQATTRQQEQPKSTKIALREDVVGWSVWINEQRADSIAAAHDAKVGLAVVERAIFRIAP